MIRSKLILKSAALLFALAPEWSGCNLTAGIDTMLSAPRLTVEQEQIYQALQRAAGSGISLKYPKSGEYLSAFTVVDLDGDGDDEAIVFYEISGASAEENPLRMCLLDQKDGEWRDVKDYTTAGAEVERISIQKLGDNPRTNLIVCYGMVDGAKYSAEILHYEDGGLQLSRSTPYSVMDVRDLDLNGSQELLVVNAATVSTAATATVYALDVSGSYYQSSVELPDVFTDFSGVLYSKLPSDDPRTANSGLAVYIDGTTGATTMQTEVLTYADHKLSLQYADNAERFTSTTRSVGCPCMDIDSDGEAEIPVQTVFYGYSSAEESEQVPMTSWYICRNGALIRKKSSYYAKSSGYFFLLPEIWEKKVTAMPAANEVVFWEMDTEAASEDGKPVLKQPLLRIASATDSESAAELEKNGYLLLRQRGDLRCYAKIEDNKSALGICKSDLLFAMRYL